MTWCIETQDDLGAAIAYNGGSKARIDLNELWDDGCFIAVRQLWHGAREWHDVAVALFALGSSRVSQVFIDGAVAIRAQHEHPIAGSAAPIALGAEDARWFAGAVRSVECFALGLTLNDLTKYLSGKDPRSLAICTLLDKPARRLVEIELAYRGFEIPDRFVIGYGLDYDEIYRNLPYIGVLKPEVYGGE